MSFRHDPAGRSSGLRPGPAARVALLALAALAMGGRAAAAETAAPAPGIVLRVDCGSPDPWRDPAGRHWQADRRFAEGSFGHVGGQEAHRGAVAITGTDLAEVYRSERYGMEAYRFTVPPGAYRVTLHWAETWAGEADGERRVFDVLVEGVPAVTDLDPYGAAGERTFHAVTRRWEGAVAGGVLDIAFRPRTRDAVVNAIEVEQLVDGRPVAGPAPEWEARLAAPSAEAGPARPVEEWIAAVEAEAAAFAALVAREPEVAVRYGEAVRFLLSFRGGRQAGTAADREAFAAFLAAGGRDLLHAWLATGSMPAPGRERWFRPLVAAYLLAGQHAAAREPRDEVAAALGLDGGAVREAAVAFYRRVETAGQEAVRRAYLTGRLEAGEVDALRLYMLQQAFRGVGERQVPKDYGLHVHGYRTIGSPAHAGSELDGRVLGQPFPDLGLATLEGVLARPAYRDEADVAYLSTWYLRPEGVLEVLRPPAGYRVVADAAGHAVCQPRPELAEAPPGTDPAHWFRLGATGGAIPRLLLLNDPVDTGPMGVSFPLAQVLADAYAGRVEVLYIATSIHDWRYGRLDVLTPGHSPHGYEATHAWSEEERARRVKTTLLRFPEVGIRCLVDNMWHHAKNEYLATGGQSRFWLIGTDGRLAATASHAGDMMEGVNAIEVALRDLLARGGVGGREPGLVVHNTDFELPPRPRVRLAGARVVAVDATARRVIVALVGAGGPEGAEAVVAVTLPANARVTVDGLRGELGGLRPGDVVDVEVELGAWAPGLRPDFRPPAGRPWHAQRRLEVALPDGRALVLQEERPQFRSEPRWFVTGYVLAGDDAPPAEVAAVRLDLRWRSVPRVWVTGRVRSFDPATGRLVVERTRRPAAAYPGLHYARARVAAGGHLALDEAAAARQAVVAGWVAEDAAAGAAPATVVFLVDAATALVRDGRAEGVEAAPPRAGDAVGVHVAVAHLGGGAAPADMVRCSSPPGP